MDIPSDRWDEVRDLVSTIKDDWDVDLHVPPPGTTDGAVTFTARTSRIRRLIVEALTDALGVEVSDGLPALPPPNVGDPVDIPRERWDEVRRLAATILEEYGVDLFVPPPGNAVCFTAPPKLRKHIRADLSEALGIAVNDGIPGVRVTCASLAKPAPVMHRVSQLSPSPSPVMSNNSPTPTLPPYAPSAGAMPRQTHTAARLPADYDAHAKESHTPSAAEATATTVSSVNPHRSNDVMGDDDSCDEEPARQKSFGTMALGDLASQFDEVNIAPDCAETTLERLVLHFKHELVRATTAGGPSRALLTVDQVSALYAVPNLMCSYCGWS